MLFAFEHIHVSALQQIAGLHAQALHEAAGDALALRICLALFEHDLQLHEATEPLDIIHVDAGLAGEIEVTRLADDAAQALTALCQAKPEEPAYKLRLAKLHIDRKRYDPAKKLLEEVLKRDAENAEAKRLLDRVSYLEFQERPQ